MTDRLLQSYPWWSLPGAIREGPALLRCARARLRWTPRLVEDLDLTLPAVYTIRGPRQVGKTTAVKLMIERSLDRSQDGVLYHRNCGRGPSPLGDVGMPLALLSTRRVSAHMA